MSLALRFGGVFWGVGGIVFMLLAAIHRLFVMAEGAFDYTLSPLQWLLLVVNVAFMAYSEGYRGFQQRFSPRVAARAKYLFYHPRWYWLLLAPLFCMGFLHATRQRQITALLMVFFVVVLIVLVRLIDQPWRGIIDIGVVVGLSWGVLSVIYYSAVALFNRDFEYPIDAPVIAIRETPQ